MHKKLLHIVLTLPNPLGSGADLRNLALRDALAVLGETVTLAVTDFLPEPGYNPSRKRSKIEADLPVDAVDQIIAQVQALSPDMIVLDGVLLADVAHALAARGLRFVLDMHNVESDLRCQIDRAKRGLWANIRYRRRWRAARTAEAAVINAAVRVMVCSEADAQRATALAGRAIACHLVPNPIPAWCRDWPLRDRPTPEGVRILFVGHLSYSPNIGAAKRLVTRLFPAIRRAMPDATLEICGRAPHQHVAALVAQTSNVRLSADPVDLAPHYAGATVAVIPLTEGGGTRLKVLEALSAGLPVVASARAVEGIGLVPGQHYLEARTDAEFVRATLRIARDAGLATELVKNGHAFVTDRFGTVAIMRAVAMVIDDACDAGTGVPAALDDGAPERNIRAGVAI